MSENKFTPGPWEIEDEYVQQAGKPDVGICSVMNMDAGGDKGWFRGVETEANARLIAAAPDLLGALQDALKALDEISHEMTVGERYTNAGQYIIDALPTARAAIAKARGES